jgi:hypothetical protein
MKLSVRIRVIEAVGIPAADMLAGTSDPYVRLPNFPCFVPRGYL